MRMSHFENGTFTNLFSVSGSVVQQTGSRVIVTHQGDNLGMGTWYCTKDKWTACSHSKKAQDYLQKVLTGDPGAVADVVPILVDVREARKCHFCIAGRWSDDVLQVQVLLSMQTYRYHIFLASHLSGLSYRLMRTSMPVHLLLPLRPQLSL